MDLRRLSVPSRVSARVLVLVLLIAGSLLTASAQSSDPDCKCIEGALSFCLPSGGVLLQRFGDRHCNLGADTCAEGMTKVCFKQGAAATPAPA